MTDQKDHEKMLNTTKYQENAIKGTMKHHYASTKMAEVKL